MSYLPIILQAAGTITSVIAQARAGSQTSSTELYKAQVAETQAKAVKTSALFQTETQKKQSEIAQSQIIREKAATMSAQRAAYAKSGVRLDEGTPLDVMADTAAQYELDLATNRYNLATGLETTRYGAETDIARLNSEAEYRRQLAKSAKKSSYLGAAGTLLTGTSDILKSIPTKKT